MLWVEEGLHTIRDQSAASRSRGSVGSDRWLGCSFSVARHITCRKAGLLEGS